MRFIWKQTFLRPVRECSLLISKWDATVPTNWNSPRCGLHLEVKSSFHETRKFFMRFVIDQNQILSTVNRCWLSVLCPIFQNRLSPWLSFGKIKVRSNKCFLLVTKTLFVGSDPMEMVAVKTTLICFTGHSLRCHGRLARDGVKNRVNGLWFANVIVWSTSLEHASWSDARLTISYYSIKFPSRQQIVIFRISGLFWITDQCGSVLPPVTIRARPIHRHSDIYRPIWRWRPGILSAKLCRYISALLAPPTPVPSERVISTAGFVYDDKRWSLQGYYTSWAMTWSIIVKFWLCNHYFEKM